MKSETVFVSEQCGNPGWSAQCREDLWRVCFCSHP